MIADTSTLAAWLLAQIEADEAAARAATGGPWADAGVWYRQAHDGEAEVSIAHPTVSGGPLSTHMVAETWREDRADAAHIARHDPARVLATCAAHRRIVELHYFVERDWVDADGDDRSGYFCALCEGEKDYTGDSTYPCNTLRALAAIYADREGFRTEWAL